MAANAALVKLMTKLQANDDNKSGQSGQSGQSGDSNGSGKKKGRKGRIAEAADRKAIAQLNRRLAESAGRVLHELILLGSGEVKQKIISAIIATVQQPGSTPPEDVPALMTILRSAAEEQLMFTQKLDSLSALLSAIEFGRWIKVPTIKLGEARRNFMNAQEARKRQMSRSAPAGTSASVNAAVAADALASDAPAAEQLESQREGHTSHRSRRKKKKDPNASTSADKRTSSFSKKLKTQLSNSFTKKLKTQKKLRVDADNARSQQRLVEFKAVLAKQSWHYRKQQRRLMSPAPALEVSSVVQLVGRAPSATPRHVQPTLGILSACSMRTSVGPA